MAGRPSPQGARTFDDAKLGSMTEPLTVRIEKRKGSTRTPIPMPPSDDGRPPGTGLTQEDVRGLEQWLVNEWAGGGYYEVTVTDSSTPAIVMKWEPFWNPTEYPEKTPPPLAEAAASQSRPTPTPSPPQVRQMTTPAFPGGFPPGLPPQPAAQPAPSPQAFFGGGAYPPYYGGGANVYGGGYGQAQQAQQSAQAWQAEAERRRTEDERRKAEDEKKAMEERQRKLEAELQAAREAAMRREYEAQLERERSASNEKIKTFENQMTELRQMIANMATAQTAQASQSAKNPELEALREQQRQTEARLEREQREREQERRERESERRDQALRDMIKAQQEDTKRQMEALDRRLEAQLGALAKASETRGPDPAFTLVKEIIAQTTQSQKDLAHQHQLQAERMQGLMMKPTDLLMLTKESQSSVDQVTERMSRHMTGVLDMQTRVMEQALQLQPQGGGAAELIRDGMTGIKDLAERYVGAQQAKATVAAQAQVEMTKQQVRAMEVEAAMRNPQAQTHAPPPPRVEAQLAGPPVGRRRKRNAAAQTPAVDNSDPLSPKRFGRTDFEWFGPLLGEVMQLREGTTAYLIGLRQEPPIEQGIDVDTAATGVVTAMQIVMQQNLPIPAMVDLLNQQRYADFMDVLLPDATQAFRDDVVTAVIAKLKTIGIDKPAVGQSKPGNTSPDDDDDDDDDDDEDDDNDDADPENDENDGKVVQMQPPPARNARNGKRPVTH
jgi:hypothetical protein